MKKSYLINSKDMAKFISFGYLKFDEIIPKNLCIKCRDEMGNYKGYYNVGSSFEKTWPKNTSLGEAFRLPNVQGIIQSMVGTDPLYDHHAEHFLSSGQLKGPNMHQDSVIDFRENYFDIQMSFFPEDTTNEMGGTFFGPGTHYRNVQTAEIRTYHHMVGKIWANCKAGTIYVWNSRIWHGSRSNHSEKNRYMYKLRLNPSKPQIRNFDTSDIHDPEIENILMTRHGWEGNAYRYELMKRVKMWRFVSNQNNYDIGEKFLRRYEYQS